MMKGARLTKWLTTVLFVFMYPLCPGDTYAQVGSDDDIGGIVLHKKPGGDSDSGSPPARTVGIRGAGTTNSSPSVSLLAGASSGSAFTWSLGFIPIGEMLVFSGRGSDGFEAQTEYHYFAPDFRYWLERVDPHHVPLRFERRRSSIFPSVRSQGKRPFQASNPRTFRLETHPTRVEAEPGQGRYLFHIASTEIGSPDGWIDHYLMMEFPEDGHFPTLHWYVDARSVQRLLPQMDKGWRTDERWAVRPIGDGLLTPIDEAFGYEMTPRPSHLGHVDGAPGSQRGGRSGKGR